MTDLKTLTDLHKKCYGNYEVAKYSMCGCFTCLEIFNGHEINNFKSEMHGNTSSICPKCNSDTVLPDVTDPVLLQELNNYFLAPIIKH